MAETHLDAVHVASASTFDGALTVTGALTATGGVSGALSGALTASGTTVTLGTQVWTFGTAEPAGGGYIGNICWNMAAGAAGTVGWYCTAPGTWKAFGTLAA